MKRLRNHLIGIDSGDAIMFSDFEHDGEMWTGDGARMAKVDVQFSEKFRNAPHVQVAPSMWDISSDANTRVDFGAENVTEAGFTIVFRTWGDSRIARMRVAWTAIGEVAHADEWDLY